MATFRSLIRGIIHGDLPPVGEKIIWRGKPKPLPTYEGFDAYWVDSGTSALALTIIAAKQLHPEVENPEVIIPAYGCPDLVAAAVFAKVQPVLVDIGKDDPGYDLDQLENAINDNTIAVIAVNFLGISDRLAEIKAVLPNNILLIEDNAQCYKAISKPDKIMGDFAITSFGRGKPVSLLGGGLALIKTTYRGKINVTNIIKKPKRKAVATITKAIIYNLLLTPQVYWLINRLPFLKVGVTKYKGLEEIISLDTYKEKIITANIDQHLASKQHPGYELANAANLSSLYKDRLIHPLRIPILNNNQSTPPEHQLKNLGITQLYKKSLINIDKVDDIVSPGQYKNASDMAKRILTLPCNHTVKDTHTLAIKGLFS